MEHMTHGVLVDADAQDAARWRYFRSVGLNGMKNEELDAAFDAAMKSAAGVPATDRIDPTACPECIGMGCEACNGTGDASGVPASEKPQQENPQ